MSDKNDVFAKAVSYPRFVERIGVLSREVSDDYTGFTNQGYDVLNDGVVVPDIVGTAAALLPSCVTAAVNAACT